LRESLKSFGALGEQQILPLRDAQGQDDKQKSKG
jgi:hypothetical protein